MIEKLELENFKCFERVTLPFANLTTLSGANGSGKSSVIQALLFVLQSAQTGSLNKGLSTLNGPLTHLGTGADVLYQRSSDDYILINAFEGSTEYFSLRALVPKGSSAEHRLEAITTGGSSNLILRPLLYLSADRLGPQKSYPVDLIEYSLNPIGRSGEYAPLMLSRQRTDKVKNKWLLMEDKDNKTFLDLESQFGLWMRQLFPGFGAKVLSLHKQDAVQLEIGLQKQVGEATLMRPSNVGYGVSVALPIVLAGLLAKPGSLLIVENPEAHLHPSGQSLLGNFLARVAAGGAQVIVETHSEHVLNGMRIALKNSILRSDEMVFLAFDRDEEFGSHRARVVELSSEGEFVAPPEKFFDQAAHDLSIIYGF